MIANERLGEGASAASEWRSAWIQPLVSAIGYAASVTHIYSLGLFIQPIEREYGWSRSDVTAGLTIGSAVIIVCGPFIGVLVDRLGPRRIAIPGLCLYCAMLAALSLGGPGLWSWRILWLFMGLAAVGIQPVVWTAAVASRFRHSRGLALAIALSGGSLCTALAPLIANAYIAELGWRGAYLALAGTLALVALPMVALFFAKGPGPGQTAAGQPQKPSADSQPTDLRKSLRSGRLAALTFISLVMTGSLMSLLVHFVPILTAAGLDRQTAATTAGVIGAASLAGRLAGGFLLDRLNGPLVAACIFALPAVATGLLMTGEIGMVKAFAIAALLGLSVGGEVDVLAYLTSRYFGLHRFGTLFALVSAAGTIGLGLGPFLASLIYDSLGGYRPWLLAVTCAAICAAFIASRLGRYQH